jgi:hypothetical protein
MLVFDDASIARVIRAAREVPFKRRRRWLADIAKRFERKRAPSPGAHYTRRSRARAKAGLAVLKAVVEEVPLVLALIDLKFLNPDVADDRRALAAAAGRALKAIARNASQPDGRIFDTIRLDLIMATLEKRKSSRGSKSSSRPQQSPARARAKD